MKTSGDPEFHEEQLTMIGMDLMSAGSDVRSQNQTEVNLLFQTTSTTLLWSVLYLVLNPEVQEHCYQEVRQDYLEKLTEAILPRQLQI